MKDKMSDKTSEKTIEVNVLHDLATCLEENFKITIIAPTQNEESKLGYDEIFSNLPSGRILALQFKRPEERNESEANFHISIPQLDTLRRNFRNKNEAFYLFSPFPTIDQFKNARKNLLESSSIVEIHDGALDTLACQKIGIVAVNTLTHQKTGTVAVNMTDPTKSRVTKRGSYSFITQIQRASQLCQGITKKAWGRKFPNPNEVVERENITENMKLVEEEKKKKTESSNSGTYFIHIQTKT